MRKWGFLMQLLIIFLLLLSQIQCKNSEPESELQTKKASFQLKSDLDITGKWKLKCISTEEDDYIARFFFKEDQSFNKYTDTYIESQCRYLGHRVEISGKYATSKISEHKSELRLLIEKVSITPKHEEVVDLFNLISFCEKNDWRLNRTKEFTTGPCAVGSPDDEKISRLKIGSGYLEIADTELESVKDDSSTLYYRSKSSY